MPKSTRRSRKKSNADILINNLSNYLSLNKKYITFIEDTRNTAKIGVTSKYQIGLTITSQTVYNRINKILQDFLKKKHNCKKQKKHLLIVKLILIGNCLDKKKGTPELYILKNMTVLNYML